MTADHAVPGEDGGRRFLIAAAVAHYQHASQWNRPGLVEARAEIVDLFTTALGYEHVSDLGLDPTKDQLTAQLRRFCRAPDRRPNDLLTIYLAGHGEVLDDNGEHVLLTADTDPDDIADALPTAELARKILLGTRVRRVLLMLDTCYSGQGGNELLAAALTKMTKPWQDTDSTALMLLTSAQPAEQAQAGAFPHLLRAAVEGLPTAGYTPATLALDAVVQAMNTHPDKPGYQTIATAAAHLVGAVPAFLPNPRYDPGMTEVDLSIQQASQWDAQGERRDIEYRTRLLVRAMGGHAPSQGWWFVGRQTALQDITNWLHDPAPGRPLLAVTAAPGSGKTAVLGLIATLAHPERRATVPLHTLGLPVAAIPAVGAVDAVIHAQNLTTDQVFQAITAAIRSHANTVGELLDQVTSRATPLTVLVDALDEAADPDQLTRKLLHPLAQHAQGRLRLLVGTRPHLLSNLGLLRDSSIDLDAPRYADLDALTTYAVRGLLEATTESPYPRQSRAVIRAVGRAVAEASNPSFLVARIISATLAATPTIPDPRDPTWCRELPRLPGQAMRRDLETRLGVQAGKVRDLLRPLAWAEGQGLPWEDLWAPLASCISGSTYTDEDLLWLRRHAGSYVIEAIEAGRSAYRLYHQALAEHLRDGTSNSAVIHQAFTRVLRSRVPVTIDGSQDWTRAHPYTLAHLATHAANAGRLDDLITDAEYLVHADPESLVPQLAQIEDGPAASVVAVYRASLNIHRFADPTVRRHLLAVDAARYDVPWMLRELNARLRTGAWQPRWATGSQVTTRLQNTLSTSAFPAVTALACTMLGGRPVVIGCAYDSLQIWDLTTCLPIGESFRHDHSCQEYRCKFEALACMIIDDQPVAITGRSDGTVQVWDLATRSIVGEPARSHRRKIEAVACTTVQGRPHAITADEGGTVLLWDLAFPNPVGQPIRSGGYRTASSVACTVLEGQPVVIIGGNDGLELWDLIACSQIGESFANDQGGVYAVACTTVQGRPWAVVGIGTGRVQRWDLTSRTPIGSILSGHASWTVEAAACTELDGRPVTVTGGEDGLRLWDLTADTPMGEIVTGLAGGIGAVACAVVEDEPVAVATSSSADKSKLQLWNLRFHRPVGEPLRGHTSIVWAVASMEINGRPIAVTGDDGGALQLWDPAARSPIGERFHAHTGRVGAIACAVLAGRPIAVTGGYDDNEVRLWDLTTRTPVGEPLTSRRGGTDGIEAVACSMVDGQPIALASGNGKVRLWDLTSRTLIGELPYGGRGVACTVLEGRPVAVTGSRDGIQLWDLTTRSPLSEPLSNRRGDGAIQAMACTMVRGRNTAVAGYDGGTVQLWDLATRTPISGRLTGHTMGVRSVACVAVKGQPVAATCGYTDGAVRLWDLTLRREAGVLPMPEDAHVVAALPDGALLIGAGYEVIVMEQRSESAT